MRSKQQQKARAFSNLTRLPSVILPDVSTANFLVSKCASIGVTLVQLEETDEHCWRLFTSRGSFMIALAKDDALMIGQVHLQAHNGVRTTTHRETKQMPDRFRCTQVTAVQEVLYFVDIRCDVGSIVSLVDVLVEILKVNEYSLVTYKELIMLI